MKRILALTAILALVAFAAVAGAQELISGTMTGTTISATATNTTTTFATANGASTSISLYNSGTNAVYVAINAVATTSSAKVPAGATLTLENFAATSIGVICATGETATVYLYVTHR